MLNDSNEAVLPNASSDEFLPPISRWITLGGLLLVGTVGVAFILAAVFKYNVTVKAPATVRPLGELRIVQAAKEGTVERIKVKENQVVKQGEIIAILEDSRLQTQKQQLQGNIQQLQRQLGQMSAQVAALDRQITAETNRSQRVIASAQADLSRNQRDYQDRQITTQTDVKEAEAALGLANAELKAYQQLVESGAVSQLQFQQKQQAVKAALARLEGVQASLNPSAANVAIAESRIAQEKATGEATTATLNKERVALIQQQIELQNQLERDIRQLQQVEIDLKQTIIAAPTDGTILKLNLRNSSQTVQPGTEIAQIAPSNTQLVVKATVTSQDISKVKVSQNVQLRVSACPYPDYGTLQGVVSTISPDAIPLQRDGTTATVGSNVSGTPSFYEVTIQPESLSLGYGTRQCPIQLGMEGRADIISREETVLQFLLRKARLITDL
ncbi:MAG: HlyD family efflux transporter periplasmic adaptor subunit [Microcoleus sp. SIO2G3]|nr:HlyD family efflux transporter periplasmic adaptor subunit [Microcoleus sp. SIO2G3]